MSNEQHVRVLALTTARAKLVELIATQAPERFDRYADLRSQARTRAAWDLVSQITGASESMSRHAVCMDDGLEPERSLMTQ
jgi:hypothetical protein